MRSGYFRLVRSRLSDRKEVTDASNIIVDRRTDSLTDDQEVGCFGCMSENGGANEIIVQNLSHSTLVDVAKQVWVGISNVQNGRLTKVELRSVSNIDKNSRKTDLRDVFILVVFFPIIVDNGRSHTVPAHNRRIFLLICQLQPVRDSSLTENSNNT